MFNDLSGDSLVGTCASGKSCSGSIVASSNKDSGNAVCESRIMTFCAAVEGGREGEREGEREGGRERAGRERGRGNGRERDGQGQTRETPNERKESCQIHCHDAHDASCASGSGQRETDAVLIAQHKPQQVPPANAPGDLAMPEVMVPTDAIRVISAGGSSPTLNPERQRSGNGEREVQTARQKLLSVSDDVPSIHPGHARERKDGL